MKIKIILLLFLVISVSLKTNAQTTMTDKQVMEYIKKATDSGKDQQAITLELARKGVTKEQLLRIKSSLNNNSNDKGIETTDVESRLRNNKEKKNYDFSNDKEIEQNLNNDSLNLLGKVIDKSDEVYGRKIFSSRNLSFEPSENLATPVNYRLGPGDEVIIDIWGTNQTTIRKTISPDGNISIDDIGLVSLNGKTIAAAESYLKKVLNKIYNGIDSKNPSSQLKVSLGNARTIQINVMGEVANPGTYSLSSFATVFHALYRAGGISDIGSLRDINLIRHGRKIATIDVYDFIMRGRVDDVRLQEGDVVIVPAYEALVKVKGKIKRPMKYEVRSGETVKTLIKYAGGMSDDAYTRSIKIVRQNGKEYQIFTVDFIDFSIFKLKNGDVVTIEPILDRYENKIEIKGAVYRPGIYEYGGKLNSLKQLIEKADGLTGDAFTTRAILHREREDLTLEVKSINVKAIMDGTQPDVILKRNDVLYIPSIHDINSFGDVEIAGEIMKPGSYIFADNMTLEDLIIQAGGLKESASTVRVDVSRRVKNNKSTKETSAIAKLYSFSLKDGFVVDGEPGFILQPYDEVFVRKSPGYQIQQNVIVDGEVLYDGTYSLSEKNERLTSVIKKAGGVTPYAYIKGCKLVRVANEEEKERMLNVREMLKRESGESKLDSLGIVVSDYFTVGIDLEKAMANPGSEYDIVLREGDKIIVPEINNTVKINGAVMMPNTVSFEEKHSVDDYISQAGGYANKAKKSNIFIVYMNGHIAKVSRHSKKVVEPGCEIVVPIKDRRNSLGLQGVLGIASSVTSLGLTAASIANILK